MVTWTHTLLGHSGVLKLLWAIFEQNRGDSENKMRKQEQGGKKGCQSAERGEKARTYMKSKPT